MNTTLSKNYEPGQVEESWYAHWEHKGYFKSTPDDRPPFTVVIPPPNVTGVLHMGHTLNETVQDVLVRHARMSGFNACWVPGSDHASIATEAKVVQMLEKEKGIKKSELTRREFLKYAFEWKEKYGGIIYHQIKKLGCSVDWSRVTFTMDDHYYEAVIKVFVDLYDKGLIYRGARMINWDPAAKTALSDEEVEYKDVTGTLYYVRYRVENSDEYITIATQRPETIMGDTAVCVNPADERYAHLKGKRIIVPLVNRAVPIIFDEYVDPAFGTGALKVTPAHDINDYNLGLKHGLPTIDTLNEDGTLSAAAEVFVGMDRFEARKAAVAQLKADGALVKEEEYSTRLGYSQRSSAVVEPRISTQWFVKMQHFAGLALDAVSSGDVKIHPEERFLATYKYWLENIKDWCISRQLWWGQRIPAWYAPDGSFVVAETREAAFAKFQEKSAAPGSRLTADDLRQDEDVLDTWFSSWLWPIEVFNGIVDPGNKDIEYYYPTNVLVTGQDIIFFWVARMIMAGMEYKQQRPFEHVYFTGMVRDKQGRKMSKSLGNSPDLLDLIDRFGADAVRFGILISSPAGNDLLFDDSSCEQGRNFNNKLWNALKLVKMWEGRQSDTAATEPHFAVEWFGQRLAQVKAQVAELYKGFRLSEALKTIYSLIWDDFCSWYLEWAKPGYEQPIDRAVYQQTVAYFSELMQLLHPFMPFITEEIYHKLADRSDDLCVKQFVPAGAVDNARIAQGTLLQEAISALRDARVKNNIKPKDPITLSIQSEGATAFEAISAILGKQVNADVQFVSEAVAGSIAVVVGTHKLYISTEQAVDASVQKEQLLKDLEYQQGFLASVEKKLNNERFVQNAKPEVVEAERKKQSDAQEKIEALQKSLSLLD
ncbi:valine--tRNA ligase [Flaviaesturariibacter aridisoli]|uniref:Valine--tRNA ligase n=1 Tax=Flaviaesturariibacter aridisoli TaxID=2545761 RepID=A0A4R4DYX6_9BACT|nr:valine--tRNA ligase [Flaviaesturariibacter aridisoli]TCZ69112.1 valine--tRNA ligase [Flaviaesturariibacter aridisoli]